MPVQVWQSFASTKIYPKKKIRNLKRGKKRKRWEL
jgi:hypothetical protein